jgi:type I restriction enzyme S subunit
MATEKKSPEVRFAGFTEDWKPTKLKDVSTYSNGGSFEEYVKKIGKYELITLKSVDVKGNLVSSGKHIDVEAPTLPKDTLVMILSEQSPGLLGVTAQIPLANKYVLNQRVAEIRPNSDINSAFLSMVINRNQEYFGQRGAGTKVQNISKPNVENYAFFIPKIKEQNLISSFISNLDSSIKNHQTQLTKLKNLKKAMLTKMLPQNGASVPEIRFKGFDGEWVEKALKNVANNISDGNWIESNHVFDKGEYRIIQTGNLGLGHFIDKSNSAKYFHQKDFDEVRGNEIFPGDILISRLAEPAGRTIILPDVRHRMVTAVDVTIIRPDVKSFDPVFLMTQLNSPKTLKVVNENVSGTSHKRISRRNLENTTFLIPELNEQIKIGRYFDNLNKLIINQQEQLKKLNNIKKACLSKLFVA